MLYSHKPRNAWRRRKLEEVRKDSCSEPSEGTDTLILDFWPSRLRENKLFCCRCKPQSS